MSHLNDPSLLTYFYTKGKQFILDGKEYKGYWHAKFGVPYSGGEPSRDSVRLYRYSTSDSVISYDRLRSDQTKKNSFKIPHFSPPIISRNQYENGQITRYFVRKRNTGDIIEINSEYARLYGQRGGIDDDLYELIQMPWKITANNFTKEIENFNAKEVAKIAMDIPEIRNYIGNFFEYSIVDIF